MLRILTLTDVQEKGDSDNHKHFQEILAENAGRYCLVCNFRETIEQQDSVCMDVCMYVRACNLFILSTHVDGSYLKQKTNSMRIILWCHPFTAP